MNRAHIRLEHVTCIIHNPDMPREHCCVAFLDNAPALICAHHNAARLLEALNRGDKYHDIACETTVNIVDTHSSASQPLGS